MNSFIKYTTLLLLMAVTLFACEKKEDAAPKNASMNNTNWKVTVTVTGSTTTQNVFEFASDGAYFAWHPGGAASYNGTWTQNDATVTFTFKETPDAGGYFWDNTGTLSNNDTVLTGTMQRRGAQGSGTFTAIKL